MLCSVSGCEDKTVGGGLCRNHYMRRRRSGFSNGMTPIERLLLRVQVADDGCWLVDGRRGKHALISVDAKPALASRAIFRHFVGPIPEGHVICHKCDEPGCINPACLFSGTYADNSTDMVHKDRQARGERHSQHKLTDADVLAIRSDSRSRRELANAYGVHSDTIGLVLNRKTWRHI